MIYVLYIMLCVLKTFNVFQLSYKTATHFEWKIADDFSNRFWINGCNSSGVKCGDFSGHSIYAFHTFHWFRNTILRNSWTPLEKVNSIMLNLFPFFRQVKSYIINKNSLANPKWCSAVSVIFSLCMKHIMISCWPCIICAFYYHPTSILELFAICFVQIERLTHQKKMWLKI